MSAKRKSRGSDAVETPDSKRHKAIPEESAEGTFEQGTALLNHLKVARDKRNHLISSKFETLPDKKKQPDYYDIVKLPIAMDTIEHKLETREYPTLTSLESDFKRMVANAKAYNEKSSDAVADAEKIRKLVSNFMVKKNPAYKDPEYSAFPTPIPGEDEAITTPSRKRKISPDQDEPAEEQEAAEEPHRKVNKRLLKLRGPRESSDAKEESPTALAVEAPANEADAEGEEEVQADGDASFEGRSFQEAQEQLIEELLNYTNDEGLEVSGPFVNLPPRSLKNYYQAIKNPVSLKGVQKRIKGVRGRDVATGVSIFKNWQSLADEISFVWSNARSYNEDGSEIYEAANEMEAYFTKRFAAARAVVIEPAQPKVTLRVPAKEEPHATKLKLHLSSKSAPAGPDGVSVDQEALKRQKELVAAGSSNHTRPTSGHSYQSADAQPSANVEAHVNDVKGEAQSSQSLEAAPTVEKAESARPGSGASEVTHGQSVSTPLPSLPQQLNGSPAPPAQRPPPPPKDPYEQRTRSDGKGISDALFSSLTIATHPSLQTTSGFRYNFYPSATLTQQVACVHFENNHNLLQIAVVLPSTLSQKSYKQVLKLNRQTVHPVQAQMQDVDPRALVYEVSLLPGLVNTLELEVLLCLTTRGQPKIGAGLEYEYERFSVFANLYS